MGAVISSPARLHHLDALLGLAAVIVTFYHFSLLFSSEAPIWYLVPLLAGPKAVMLFFVLSGYVLSLPYWKGTQPAYWRYAVRRICRIYLPYAAAVGFALLVGFRLLHSTLGITRWFHSTWHQDFTWQLIGRQLVFGSVESNLAAINTAFWSLRYEMEMSLVFPLIIWMLLKLPGVGGWLLAFGCEFIGQGRVPSIASKHEVLSTFMWGSAFIFGAVLARDTKTIRRWFLNLHTWARYLFAAVVIGGFYLGTVPESVNIPAAVGVIILADGYRGRLLLSHPFFLYLGQISYSLYLVHGTILFASFILLHGLVPPWVIALIYFCVSFLVAHLSHRYVEVPSMRLGKFLTSDSPTILILTPVPAIFPS